VLGLTPQQRKCIDRTTDPGKRRKRTHFGTLAEIHLFAGKLMRERDFNEYPSLGMSFSPASRSAAGSWRKED
jgi:hypothetical protein